LFGRCDGSSPVAGLTIDIGKPIFPAALRRCSGGAHSTHGFGVIRFEISREGPGWRLMRNHRLVCYFSTRDEAVKLVTQIVANIRATGRPAELHIDKRLMDDEKDLIYTDTD